MTITVYRAALLAVLAIAASTARVAQADEAIGLLNDTGQADCYTTGNAPIACDEEITGDDSPLPRQDARYGRDAAAAKGRLAKIGGGEFGFDLSRVCMNGDVEGEGDCPLSPSKPEDVENPLPTDWACVRDNVTGLTWSLGNLSRVNWDEVSRTDEGSFIGHANATARCGLASGWRLAARREGYSLQQHARSLPSVDPTYFPVLSYVQGDGGSPCYWSSDVFAAQPLMNHLICFDGPNTGGVYQCRDQVAGTECNQPTEMRRARVLLVNGQWRTPTAAEGRDRFDVEVDRALVEDTATGLVWDRCSWGQEGTECSGDGIIFQRWADAMQVAVIANEQRYKGYYDWRIPNTRELESLIDTSAHDPAIDTTVFPNTAPEHYWTASTTWVAFPTNGNYAGNVRFDIGMVTLNRKVPSAVTPYPERSRIRLVRSGAELGAYDGVSERLLMADFEGAPTP